MSSGGSIVDILGEQSLWSREVDGVEGRADKERGLEKS
jgi:hypothetical protein